jgi:hypothetical protein
LIDLGDVENDDAGEVDALDEIDEDNDDDVEEEDEEEDENEMGEEDDSEEDDGKGKGKEKEKEKEMEKIKDEDKVKRGKKETVNEQEWKDLNYMWNLWSEEERVTGVTGRWKKLFQSIDWMGLVMSEAKRMCGIVYADYPEAWKEVRVELQRFLSNGFANHPMYEDDNAYDYWRMVQHDPAPDNRVPHRLAEIAVRLLSSTASEAACERSFGYMKLLIGDRRRRLGTETVFYLMVLAL